jgi:hypothetical protein
MASLGLRYNTRKSLCVQMGEGPGNEIADLIQKMAQRIEALERNKVNVTWIVPADAPIPLVNVPALDATVSNEAL